MEATEIELGIDWGTWKFVVAYAVNKDGKRMSAPLPVSMYARALEVPMMATWINGQFTHGFALQDLSENDPSIGDQIIDLFKLPLYRLDGPSIATGRIESILSELPGNKTLDDLITDHISAVVSDAKESIMRSAAQAFFKPDELAELLRRAKVCITVPQMWPPDACARMQKAAVLAGLELVTLASEPKCALSYYVNQMASRMIPGEQRFIPGHTIMVLDIGSGTCDIAMYRLLAPLSQDSRLQPIGNASGALCGSSKVDQLLYEHLVRREGPNWIPKSTDCLQVSARCFERLARKAIEKLKARLSKQLFYTEVIQGVGRNFISIQLSKEEIEHALDLVLEMILGEISQVCQNAKQCPSLLQVTGGFANSEYIMKRLQKHCEEDGIVVVRVTDNDQGRNIVVAIGALLRFDNITEQQFPSTYGFAMLRQEEFSLEHHGDSYTRLCGLDEDPSELDIIEGSDIKVSWYDDSVKVVDDRIFNIVHKESDAVRGKRISQSNLEFRPAFEDPIISVEFIYLTEAFEDHVAAKEQARTGRTKDYVFRSGVHPWKNVDFRLSKRLLQRKNLEIITANGEKFWLLYVTVIIECEGKNLRVGLSVKDPQSSHGGNDDDDQFARREAFMLWEEIFDSHHSEFQK